MSHWNGYETRDIFSIEDSGANNLLPFQDGDKVLESATFSDSYKKTGFMAAIDVGTSIFHEGLAIEAALPKKDERVLLTVLEGGSSSVLDPSLSFISGKAPPAVGITECSAGNSILEHYGNKISTKSIREGENDTGNDTLSMDYEKMVDIRNKKHCEYSADAFVGILTKEQTNGNDDYPNIVHFEDFKRTFRNHGSTFAQGSSETEDELSWFSSSSHGFLGVEDTLQSVVLSSVSASNAFNNASKSHSLGINILSGTKPSINCTDFPSNTDCISLPLYSDCERMRKPLMSEMAYDLTLEQSNYENDCRNPNMFNMSLKELSTTKGKDINLTFGSTSQSPLSGCGLIQIVQDQELLPFSLPAPQPSSPRAISKKTLFSESFASNCLHSYNPQAQMNELLKSTIGKSSDLPEYVTSKNLLSRAHAHNSVVMLPEPFSIPLMPTEESKKIYDCQQFPATWVLGKPLEQHIDKALKQHSEASDSSSQRKYIFDDVGKGDKEPAVNIGFSSLQDKTCMTSTFIDDVPIEAACFQQFQMIMDQLGVATKLCIRDSLYRLARSAEQSHCYGSANNVSRESSPVRGFQGSKRPQEFLDLSISTNEIERAVAYLLFHKSLGCGAGMADDSI